MENFEEEAQQRPDPLLARVIPARYLFAVLGSIGFAIIYGLKVNLSVALVVMVNHTALATLHEPALVHEGIPDLAQDSDECQSQGIAGSSPKGVEDGPFVWEEPLQGYILASYFWGYLVTQLPGGRLAELFSAKWVMLVAVLVNAICTILTPPAAQLHAAAVFAVRIGEGLGAGLTFPAMHVMISKWAPPNERSVLSSIIYAGTALGTVTSMLLAGVLASSLGWASVFYVMGALSLIWCVLWVALVADSPAKQKLISRRERQYIHEAFQQVGQTQDHETLPVPWQAVLKSGPFWAILISHICSNFGWYMLLIELPTYMRQILHFSIQENAGLSALPFFLMWVFSMTLGQTLKWAQARKILSITAARKISTTIASAVPAICLLLVSFVGCERTAAVTLMAVAVMSVGGMFSGFLSNHIDIAPNFAGTLMAITNTFATIPGFLVPVFVGQITHGNQTIGAWRIIFFTTVGLFGIESLVYLLLGSGEEQQWNKSKTTQTLLTQKPKDEPNKDV